MTKMGTWSLHESSISSSMLSGICEGIICGASVPCRSSIMFILLLEYRWAQQTTYLGGRETLTIVRHLSEKTGPRSRLNIPDSTRLFHSSRYYGVFSHTQCISCENISLVELLYLGEWTPPPQGDEKC